MNTVCPTDDFLRRFAIGDCDESDSQVIEQHLVDCPACEDTVARFDTAGDTLMRFLPLAAKLPEDPAPAWLDRLRNGPVERIEPEQQTALELPSVPSFDSLSAYELLGVIGKGGMGVVYRARHRQLNREVAIKVLNPRLMAAPEARRRFEREIQILGALRHPGIVMATDAGRIEGSAYLVMEFVEGIDLSRLVRRGGPLSIAEACDAVRQMAQALAAAHATRTVHRDVKPSNTMVDRQGQVKLLDFGLAHLATLSTENRDTSLGQLLGTLDYMAPEQADLQQEVDPRADLYSLGATLFFLLTGQPPHGTDVQRSLLQQLRHLTSQEPARATTLRADIPPELDDLIARLLSRDPDCRPANAAEVAQALAEWAGGELSQRVAEVTANLEPAVIDQMEASRSLSQLLGIEEQRQISRTVIEMEPPRRSRFARFLIGLTLLLIFAAGGYAVTILVDTPEGTLRIESTLADVKVELVDEKEQAQPLTVERGSKETLLRAGKYRIRFAGEHSGLTITPSVITILDGKEQVAKITREGEVIAPTTALTPAAGEPIYEGIGQSEWERRFHAETQPVAKIEAAKALVTLSQSLPDAAMVERVIEVCGEVFNFGWRGNQSTAALQQIVRGNDSHPSFHGESLNQIGELTSASRKLVMSANITHLVQSCDNSLKTLDAGRQGAAIWVASLRMKEIAVMPGNSKFLFDSFPNPVSNELRDAMVIVLSSAYNAFDTKIRLHLDKQLTDSAKHLIGSADTPSRSLLVKALFTVSRAQQPKWDAIIAAQLVSRELQEDQQNEYWEYFDHPDRDKTRIQSTMGSSRSTSTELPTPFHVDAYRKHTHPYLDAWLALLNQKPEWSQNDINTLNNVLQARLARDVWPVDVTAKRLTELAEQYYKNPMNSAVSPISMYVMPIILCTGRIPTTLKDDSLPPEVAIHSEALQQLLGTNLTTAPRLGTLRKQFILSRVEKLRSFSGWLYFAPQLTVNALLDSAIIEESSSDHGNDDSQVELPVFTLLTIVDLLDGPDGRMPLPLLATYESLTGTSENKDAKIARHLRSLFLTQRDGTPRNLLIGHFHPESAAKQIVTQILQRMADKTKSPLLLQTIHELDSSVTLPDGIALTVPRPAVENKPTEPTPTPPATATPSSEPEVLYQGVSQSEWETKFHAETEPNAKITAARALATLATRLPEERAVDRLISVASQIFKAGWHDNEWTVAIQNVVSSNSMPPRWKGSIDPTTLKEFDSHFRQLLSVIAAPAIVSSLGHAMKDEDPGVQAAAVWMASFRISAIAHNPSTAEEILRLIKDPRENMSHLSLLLVVASAYADFPADCQASINQQMNEAGDALLLFDRSMAREAFLEAWMNAARTENIGVDPMVAAKLINHEINTRGLYNSFVFDSRPSPIWQEKGRTYFRERTAPYLHAWLKLLNEKPEWTQHDVDSIYYVLQVRLPEDNWPVDQTVKRLTEMLRRYYDKSAESPKPTIDFPAVKLLRPILWCTGTIPDFVRTNEHRDSETVNKLQRLSDILSSNLDPPRNADGAYGFAVLSQTLRPLNGLVYEDPHGVVQALIHARKAVPGKRRTRDTKPLDLLEVHSILRLLSDGHQHRWDALDVVQLLCSYEQFVGTSVEQDLTVSTQLGQLFSSTGGETPGHQLRSIANGPTAIAPIIRQILQRMADNAKSPYLVKTLRQLDSAVKVPDNLAEQLAALDKVEPKPQEAKQSPSMPTPEKVPSQPEVIYQGVVQSEWERKFHAETEPNAKITAAQALVTLAGGLPNEKAMDRLIQIAGELLNSGWKGSEFIGALQDLVPTHPTPPQWANLLSDGPFRALDSSIRRLVASQSEVSVVQALDNALKQPDLGIQSAALWLTSMKMADIAKNPETANRMLALIKDPNSYDVQRALTLLAGSAYQDFEPEHRKNVKLYMDEVAQSLCQLPDSSLRTAMVNAWIHAARTKLIDVDANIGASLVNREINNSRLYDYFSFFGAASKIWETSGTNRFREMTRPYLEGWLLFLNNKPEWTQYDVDSIYYVMQARLPEDNWPVEETAKRLTEMLRQYYDDKSTTAPSPKIDYPSVKLLRPIIWCTGTLPEFVQTHELRDMRIRKNLAEFKGILSATIDLRGSPRSNFEHGVVAQRCQLLSGLIYDDPHGVLKFVLRADATQPENAGSRLQRKDTPLDLLDSSTIFDFLSVQNTQFTWEIFDPTLLLCILEQFVGASIEQDLRVDEVLRQEFLPFRNSTLPTLFRDIANGPTAIADIMTQILQRMADKAKSPYLVKTLRQLDSTIKVPAHLAEQLVALDKVEQKPQEATQSPPMPAVEKETSAPEAIYQGLPQSEWETKFHAETEPNAKITAARALVVLAANLPDDMMMDRLVKISAELINAGWRGAQLSAAVQEVDDSAKRPTQWDVNATKDSIQGYVAECSRLLATADPSVLVGSLGKTLDGKDVGSQAATIWLASLRIGDIMRTPEAAKRVITMLDRPLENEVRWVLVVMTSSAYDVLPMEEQGVLDKHMTQVCNDLLATARNPRNLQIASSLITSARDNHIKVDPVSAAKLVRNWLVPATPFGLEKFFRPTTGKGYPASRNNGGPTPPTTIHFPDLDVTGIRQRTNPYLHGWVATLVQEPDWTIDDLLSLEYVLSLRMAEDNWPVGELAERLTTLLRSYYEGADSPPSLSVDLPGVRILRNILWCGGQVPEFVRTQKRTDSQVVRELAGLEQLLDKPMPPEGADRSNYLGHINVTANDMLPLFHDDPYNIMRILLTSPIVEHDDSALTKEIPSSRGKNLFESQKALSINDALTILARPVVNEGQTYPDPVVLLSMYAEFAGTSEAMDGQINKNIHRLYIPGHHFARIEDYHQRYQKLRLRPTVFAPMMTQILQRMADKAISRRLVETLCELDPQVKRPERFAEPDAQPKGEPKAETPPAEPKGTPMPPMEATAKPAEPVYEGLTQSEWEAKFQAETEPKTKITAARALVNLASTLPDEKMIERLLELAGELIDAGWRGSPVVAVFDGKAPQWGDDPLHGFRSDCERLIGTCNNGKLLEVLRRTLEKGDDNSRIAALWLLNTRVIPLSEDESAVSLLFGLFDLPLADQHRHALVILACSGYRAYNDQQKQRLAELMTLTGNELYAHPTDDPNKMTNAWILAAQANHIQVDPEAAARLVYRKFQESSNLGYLQYYQRDEEDAIWLNLKSFRASSPWVGAWLKVLNEQPEWTHREVLSLRHILQARLPEDNWPVKETAERLTRMLEKCYEGSEESPPIMIGERPAMTLLRPIVWCTGELPELVKTKQLKDRSVSRDISRLPEWMTTTVPIPAGAMEHAATIIASSIDSKSPTLMLKDPYRVVQSLICTEWTDLMENSLKAKTSQVERARLSKTIPINVMSPRSILLSMANVTETADGPKMDPIEMLCIFDALVGESESRDQLVSTYLRNCFLDERSALGSHYMAVISGPSVLNPMCTTILQRMADKSKSRRLVETIRQMDPRVTMPQQFAEPEVPAAAVKP